MDGNGNGGRQAGMRGESAWRVGVNSNCSGRKHFPGGIQSDAFLVLKEMLVHCHLTIVFHLEVSSWENTFYLNS